MRLLWERKIAASLRMQEEVRRVSLLEKNHPISMGENFGKDLREERKTSGRTWSLGKRRGLVQ